MEGRTIETAAQSRGTNGGTHMSGVMMREHFARRDAGKRSRRCSPDRSAYQAGAAVAASTATALIANRSGQQCKAAMRHCVPWCGNCHRAMRQQSLGYDSGSTRCNFSRSPSSCPGSQAGVGVRPAPGADRFGAEGWFRERTRWNPGAPKPCAVCGKMHLEAKFQNGEKANQFVTRLKLHSVGSKRGAV